MNNTGPSAAFDKFAKEQLRDLSVAAAFRRNDAVRIAFVTNFCAHYRVKTFEILAEHENITFLFTSAGEEWYWQQQHGVRAGNFRYEYLPAIRLTRRLRLVPSLMTRLWGKNYDVYIKCINGRFALAATYAIAKLRHKPFILWTGIWMTLDTRFHRLIFPLTRWIYRHADAIVVYGEHVKSYLISLGVPAKRIFVAHHAMDNESYSRPVPEEQKTELRKQIDVVNCHLVMYLGRLEPVKGVEYLIEAFASLDLENTRLIIVGEGALKEPLTARARELGMVEKIRFIGYASPEQAVNYYAIADVLVLPSITTPTGKETWGLVVNEAMNQGVPVVVTQSVGAAAGGLVQSGVNGFIVPERNPQALTQAIKRILTDDRLREQLSDNARQIIANWNNERMIKGFRKAIGYVLEEDGFRTHHAAHSDAARSD